MTILRPIIWIAGITLLGSYSSLAASQPPQIHVIPETSKAIAHQPYEVRYEVTWTGDAGDRAVLPPSLVDLDWADVTVASSVASVRDGMNVIQHSLVLYPRESGTFEFPALTLAYLDPADYPGDENSEEDQEPVYPTISAESFQITVVEPPDPLTYIIGATLLLVMLAGAIMLMRRRQVTSASKAQVIPMPTVPDAMNAARQHRLDRRHYEFYQALLRGVSLLSRTAEHTAMKTLLEKKAKEVGYQDYHPTEDELDGALRDLERAYNQDKGSKA